MWKKSFVCMRRVALEFTLQESARNLDLMYCQECPLIHVLTTWSGRSAESDFANALWDGVDIESRKPGSRLSMLFL
jgi:NMD protein affecting ribosome stability and mRNA decay